MKAEKPKRLSFDELRKFADDYWGLSLIRSPKDAHGYWPGAWKTGYTLTGNFPGDRHGSRRFSTLKAVARVLRYPKGV